MNFNFLNPYVAWLLLGIFSLLILYLKTLISEKAKARALKHTNEELEKLKSTFAKEIEELRRNHQLDISKRKYQYESKKEQYIRFFSLLDELTIEATNSIQEKAIPIIEEFQRSYLSAASKSNKSGENKALIVLVKKAQRLLVEANKSRAKFKNETNTIRLIASSKVVDKIEALDIAYENIFEKSSKMLSNLAPLMMTNAQDEMIEEQRKMELAGKNIVLIKDEIKELMRKELNEI